MNLTMPCFVFVSVRGNGSGSGSSSGSGRQWQDKLLLCYMSYYITYDVNVALYNIIIVLFV